MFYENNNYQINFSSHLSLVSGMSTFCGLAGFRFLELKSKEIYFLKWHVIAKRE